MLCEKCQQNEATIHLTQVVEGDVKKLHLCEGCAEEAGFEIHGQMSITDFLMGQEGEQEVEESSDEDAAPDQVCASCGLSRNDFKKGGRLGCSDCYAQFSSELHSLIKAMHHSTQHIGKVPSRESVLAQATAEIADLEKKLKLAVSNEQFEQAASYRDRLAECRTRVQQEQERLRDES